MKQVLYILFLTVVINLTIHAQNMLVSGAGSTEVNGYYLPYSTSDGTTSYKNNNNIYLYRFGDGKWRFSATHGSFNASAIYYYSDGINFSSTADAVTYNTIGALGTSPGPSVTSTPLPVELTSFSALVNKTEITLKWQTATEVNNYGFFVERASLETTPGPAAWENISFVKGNGNSNSQKQYSYIDKEIAEGTYQYRLKQVDNNGSFEYSKTVEASFMKPIEFELEQNYPNPFNPTTTFGFNISNSGLVTLKVYDVIGNEITTLVNEEKEPGSYEVKFDGSSLASGVYYYRLTSGNFTVTRKLLLMK